MAAYIILVLIIFLGTLVPNNNKKITNLYLFIIFFTMLVIVGLRHFSLGNYDTELIYVPKIERFMNLSFSEIIEIQGSKDLLFWLVVRFINLFTESTHVVIFVLAIPFLLSAILYVKKYSKKMWLSFALFLGLGYFEMSFYILRQVVAMSLILLSYQYLIKRNLKMFVLVVLCAGLFHQTAIIFLIVYPIVNIKFSTKHFILILVGLGLSTVSQISIMQRIVNILNLFISDTSRYDLYLTRDSGLNYTGFVIQLCVLLCVLICLAMLKQIELWSGKRGKLKNWGITIKNENLIGIENRELNSQLNLLCISLFFMALSPVIGEFWRVASYFGIFSINLLPNIISRFKYKSNRITFSAIVGASYCLYFLFFRLENAHMLPYKFFWM